MFFKKAIITTNDIVTLIEYHPYWLVYKMIKNPSFDKNSKAMLEVKQGNMQYINDLHKHLAPLLGTNFAICIVPSHKQSDTNRNSPLSILAKKLVKSNNLIDATDSLVRVKSIDKLSNGGCRDIDIHLNSINVVNVELFKGKQVLIIDDITTTGNSLNACKELLLRKGAVEVAMLAIAKTVNY